MSWFLELVILIAITLTFHVVRIWDNIIPPGVFVSGIGSILLVLIHKIRTKKYWGKAFLWIIVVWSVSNIIFLDTERNVLLTNLGLDIWNDLIIPVQKFVATNFPTPIFLIPIDPVLYVLFCFFPIQIYICIGSVILDYFLRNND